MSGLGHEKLVTRQMPLPTTMDGILDAIRSILAKKSIHSIRIEKDKPIYYQRLEDESAIELGAEPEFNDLTPYEIARRSEMKEFDLIAQRLDGEPPLSIVGWMLIYIETQKLVPTHLLVAETTNFWKWVCVGNRTGAKLDTFMGMKVERDQQMPSQAFLIFGSEDRWAGVENAKIVLKGAC